MRDRLAHVVGDAMTNANTNAVAAEQTPARATRRAGLSSPSFLGLLITQLLTAVNDNIFRWLAIGIGKDYVTPVERQQHLDGRYGLLRPALSGAGGAGRIPGGSIQQAERDRRLQDR